MKIEDFSCFSRLIFQKVVYLMKKLSCHKAIVNRKFCRFRIPDFTAAVGSFFFAGQLAEPLNESIMAVYLLFSGVQDKRLGINDIVCAALFDNRKNLSISFLKNIGSPLGLGPF